MANETKKQETSTQVAPGLRKKLSVKSVKLSDQEIGFSFKGKFLQWTKGQPFTTVDQKSGEIVTKELQFALFENDAGERISYVADKGLVDAMSMAGVTEGLKIEVVKLPKAKIGKGREMNQYDIFTA